MKGFAIYFSVGFVLGLLQLRASEHEESVLLALLLFFFWPIAAPILVVLTFFRWIHRLFHGRRYY